MDVERRDDRYSIIKPSDGEENRQILRSLAVASFEMARPVGMGWLHHESGSTMTPEDADRFITERNGRLELDMDYVQGRQVKTFIRENEQGDLEFDSWTYERDRGDSAKLFTRAQEISSGEGTASLPVELVSTNDQYTGKSLDSTLSQYGVTRQEGETDMEYRARAFPFVFEQDQIRALEFLFGQSATEWNAKKAALTMLFLEKPDKTPEAIKGFADLISEFSGELQ